MTDFDACIDLTVHNVPAGIPADVAVSQVRAAIETLPGAGWISVTWLRKHLPEFYRLKGEIGSAMADARHASQQFERGL